jgi:acetyl-CoA synthetase
MSEDRIVPSAAFSAAATINPSNYQSLYQQSITDPESFWGEQAARLDWVRKWDRVKDTHFSAEDVRIRWFEGGKLNVASNCLDRHLEKRGDKTAILWESDDGKSTRTISFRQLHADVSRLANFLKSRGVQKGDCVTIYMPMVPEAAVAMLACARIGAMHSVVFAGFSPDAVRGRLVDGKSRFIITADEGLRGGKHVPLKANIDAAIAGLCDAEQGGASPCQADAAEEENAAGTQAKMQVLVYQHTGADITMKPGRDFWWHEHVPQQSAECAAEVMDAEDPLFILYTSGSTGTPKGVLHTTGGYLLYAALTHAWVFDVKEDDIYWCTADVGWVTGHSYMIYGPLANGTTTLMFEGVPNYPDMSRFWQVVDKHKVSIFYTAPTAIRALMREGDEWVTRTSRKSLRVLASVGEPINPEAWRWYHRVVGDGRCPIADTWWQTETGGHLITPMVGVHALKPGSAMQPFFGVKPAVLSPEGAVLEGEAEGMLCIADSWPGQARTIYGDHARFVQTYFSSYPGYYFSGDGCKRDADGDYWITGRVDDVMNISGHRIGTAEVESALVLHAKVAEAAVVGFPHDIKGQGIYCYVLLNEGETGDDALLAELKAQVRREIGPIATPDRIVFAPGLPKTRSGKIMRRILRKIAANEADGLGDISTLQNPEVVAQLIALHEKG